MLIGSRRMILILLEGAAAFQAPWGQLEIASPCSSLTKNRRPYMHECRTFFNCDRVILRHTHRKLSKIDQKLSLQTIAQLTQFHKIFPRRFCIFSNRQNTHQTKDRQSQEHEQLFHLLAQRVERKSEFA